MLIDHQIEIRERFHWGFAEQIHSLDEILNHDWSRLNNNMNIIMDFHAAPRQ
jgi:hypothetical protein